MNCPNCKSQNTSKVKWNVWGGIIGALIANQRKCNNCGLKFKPDSIIVNDNKGFQEGKTSNVPADTAKACPHCENLNSKDSNLCEWCGNQIEQN